MSIHHQALLATGGLGAVKAFSDDVFSAYTYTGNGSTQTINNGIDLAGKGGLVWLKNRSSDSNGGNVITDTVRGLNSHIYTDNTLAQNSNSVGITSVFSNGFSLGSWLTTNTSSTTYVSWTFAKAKKFFDIVTYTGNGVAGRQIPHALGIAPGMIVIKRLDAASSWPVYHRGANSGNAYLFLESTNAQVTDNGAIWGNGAVHTEPDASIFTLAGGYNQSGGTYVAYLFAHDTSADGIIQCGSYTSTGADVPVTLGFEPQFLLIKNTNISGNSSTQWGMFDSSRGLTMNADCTLFAESSSAESTASNFINPTATGFIANSGGGTLVAAGTGNTHIYLAIRRPNKPPTSGTQVYNAIARTGTNAVANVSGVGFPPDLAVITNNVIGGGTAFVDKLRGRSQALMSTSTAVELSSIPTEDVLSFDMSGITVGTQNRIPSNRNSINILNHFFRRATGFMDIVCDTGTGAAHTVAHNLVAIPELILRKSRSAVTSWEVYHSSIGNASKLVLNVASGTAADATAWNSTTPTASVFTVGTGANVNTNAATYVNYLFATLTGISKVGNYTGNGSTQSIDCGFTAGARFFLVKSTSVAGSWWIFDSVRGIVAAADPVLALNSTAAEITSADAVDPFSSGIIVNQEANCSINASGVSYIYLAIA